MSDLEQFLHGPTPILLKAALAHVQFETIHPFLDGNGRVGRLLITLLLCAENVLQQPLLYLSLFFKQHRDAYYDHLQRVRTEGAWEAWLEFFLEGVVTVAGSATDTARRDPSVGRCATAHESMSLGAARLLLSGFTSSPAAASCSRQVALRTSCSSSAPTVNAAFARLEDAGILREVTGRKRGRLFVYDGYLQLLQGDR